MARLVPSPAMPFRVVRQRRCARDLAPARRVARRPRALRSDQENSICMLAHERPEPTTTHATTSPGLNSARRCEITDGAPAAAWLP